MKKLFLLSGMALAFVVGVNAMEQERPATYKMLDPLVEKYNWPAIFAVLDQMQGVIDVNEYRSPDGFPLLVLAAIDMSFLAVKTLLEKYKANPNVQVSSRDINKGGTSLEWACYNSGSRPKKSVPIVKLLLHYGANPYIKHARGYDSFTWAEQIPSLLKLLQEYGYSRKPA